LDFNYLSLIVFLPLVGAIIVAFMPNIYSSLIKRLAVLFTFIPLVLTIFLFCRFDRSLAAVGMIQFEEKVSWIPLINAHYHLGVDGLSLPLLLLTSFLGFLAVLLSWKIELRPREYFAWLLLLETSILGVFCSLDFLLFFIFWEIEIIPMFFLISIWGMGRKEYSAMKYVIYTLFGSAMMLAGILSLYFTTGSLSMVEIGQTGLTSFVVVIPAVAIFFLLFTGFAVKLPVFPFHTWLPDAHTDAPTAVSVMLAGALLKMGGYGMIRVCVTIFPQVAHDYAPILLGFAVVNVLYAGAITLRQTDLKRLVAYSSISHMGYVLLGIFALSQTSLTGATLQMFSHGFITGLLFAVTGVIMHNTGERDIRKLGGLARQMPIIATVFIIGGLGAMAVPATSGFIAEFFVFLGSFSSTAVAGVQVYTILCLLGVILAAGYILWTIQRVFYGPVLEKFKGVTDADGLEKIYMFIFVIVIVLVGIYPTILTDVIKLGTLPIIGG